MARPSKKLRVLMPRWEEILPERLFSATAVVIIDAFVATAVEVFRVEYLAETRAR